MDTITRTDPAIDDGPVSLWAMGRQRVGKTTFLNGLIEVVRSLGGTPEIWNADLQNKTGSLSVFHRDAMQPPASLLGEQKLWIEERIGEQMETRRDAVLDIGGGWTALHQLVDEGPISRVMQQEGVRLTLVYVLGPDRADVDYLEDMQARGFSLPERTVIVLNQGLVPWSYDPARAFEPVTSHPVVRAAVEGGAKFAFMPPLSCLDEVGRQGLSLSEFLDPRAKAKYPPITPLKRMSVRRWLETDFPAFLRQIPADWLPRLAPGETY